MRHKDVIYLISIESTEDDIGNSIDVEVKRQVFANKFYINQSEFYNAQVTGLKPSQQFEIYSFEYQDESKLEHEGIRYSIIRVEERGDKARITCEKVIGNGK